MIELGISFLAGAIVGTIVTNWCNRFDKKNQRGDFYEPPKANYGDRKIQIIHNECGSVLYGEPSIDMGGNRFFYTCPKCQVYTCDTAVKIVHNSRT